jgi:hypothetical protein
MVGGDEARLDRVAAAVAGRDQGARAGIIVVRAGEGVERGRCDLLAIIVALGTDRVEVAAAGQLRTRRLERRAVAEHHVAELQHQVGPLGGRQVQLERRAAAGQQRAVVVTVGPVVGVGERSDLLFPRRAAQPQPRTRGQAETAEAQLERARLGRFDLEPPLQAAVVARGPDAALRLRVVLHHLMHRLHPAIPVGCAGLRLVLCVL